MMHFSSSIHEFTLLGHSVRHTYSKEDFICKPQLPKRTMQIVHKVATNGKFNCIRIITQLNLLPLVAYLTVYQPSSIY
jgi:hypothetical protein